jgi:hypothetical protein
MQNVNTMTNNSNSRIAAVPIALILGFIPAANIARAQAQPANNSANSSDPNGADRAAAIQQPTADASQNGAESSLFYSLFMAGKTQDQFQPLTAKERLKVYAKDLLSPFHFAMAGASAGITQVQNVPPEWGQGAEGYARRFANYYAYATTSSMLQMAGEDLLHEDNLYYGSGEHGVWKRVSYAVKSSVLARGNDGTQHISISQIGSTAGAAFISRLWQPASNNSAGDGAVSFGISMATNAGVNVIREFLPDVTRHIFHRAEQ